MAAARQLQLTVREREVLHLLAESVTAPEIAERLGLTPGTVYTHLRAVVSKMSALRSVGDARRRVQGGTAGPTGRGANPADVLRKMIEDTLQNNAPLSVAILTNTREPSWEDVSRTQAAVRRADWLIPWGANSLMVVLAHTAETAAWQVAQRLREKTLDPSGWTLSVVQWKSGEGPDELLQRADGATWTMRSPRLDAYE